MSQQAIKTPNNAWTAFELRPMNLAQPFEKMNIGIFADGIYTGVDSCIWVDKDTTSTDTVVEKTRQPQGYDHYFNQYTKARVRKTKYTIQFMADASAATGERYIGGFSSLYDNQSGLTTILEKMGNITQAEVIDMLNVKFIKKPRLIVSATSDAMRPGQTFQFTYDARIYQKHLKRIGFETGDDWYAGVGVAPQVNPKLFFAIADIGLPSSAIYLYFTISVEHTVEFSDLITFDRSTL